MSTPKRLFWMKCSLAFCFHRIALAFNRVFVAVGRALEHAAEREEFVQQANRKRA